MDGLDLIKKLHTQSLHPDTTISGVSYQEYDVTVFKKNITVLIPLRECEHFEQRISQTLVLTSHKLKQTLKEFRGFIQTK